MDACCKVLLEKKGPPREDHSISRQVVMCGCGRTWWSTRTVAEGAEIFSWQPGAVMPKCTTCGHRACPFCETSCDDMVPDPEEPGMCMPCECPGCVFPELEKTLEPCGDH